MIETHSPNLSVREVPQYLLEQFGIPIALATLNKMRVTGGGPAFRKFGSKVLYPVGQLDEWAVAKLGGLRRSTSDEGLAA